MFAGVSEGTPMRFSGVTSKVVDVRPARLTQDPEFLRSFRAGAVVERESEMRAELLDVRREVVRQEEGRRRFESFQPEESRDPRGLFQRQHLRHPREVMRGRRRRPRWPATRRRRRGDGASSTTWRGSLANAFEQHPDHFAAIPIVAPRDPFRPHAPLQLGAPVHFIVVVAVQTMWARARVVRW